MLSKYELYYPSTGNLASHRWEARIRKTSLSSLTGLWSLLAGLTSCSTISRHVRYCSQHLVATWRLLDVRPTSFNVNAGTYTVKGDLAEWSERCACVPKVAGSSPTGGSESTFRSDWLLTARGSSMWVLWVLWLPVCCVTRVTHSAFSA
jgi:hypothetical protein